MISSTSFIVMSWQGMKNTLIVLCLIILLYYTLVSSKLLSKDLSWRGSYIAASDKISESSGSKIPLWEQSINFEGFNNVTGTEDGCYIVPNYIHFIKFGQTEFSFVHAICVLAAFKHQRPEKIFFHTDVKEFQGKYWEVIMSTPGLNETLVMRKKEVPTEVFGQTLNKGWKYFHGGDVARMQVLLEFGGIYLDSDTYIVRSLNDLRRFEMSIGWRYPGALGNQIVVAHKNARFLKLWYESYRNNYRPKEFYWNTGTYPAKHILKPNPHLVHRVPTLFGNYGIKKSVYLTPWPEWREYYALHMLFRHLKRLRGKDPNLTYPVVFNESNVLDYPIAFRDMCIDVYPYSEQHKLITDVR